MNRSLSEKAQLIEGISHNTVLSRLGTWIKNTIENGKEFSKYNKIVELKNRFSNVPAIIVGAGPSLGKNIELLKFAKNKALIICVDTVMKEIEKYVEPDIVVALDSGEALLDYINFENSESKVLFADVTLSPKVIEKWNGKIYWFISGFSSIPYLDEIIERDFLDNDEVGRTSAGGCVVNSAIYIARKILNCDPIILLGADCGFYDIKQHHHGSANSLEEKNVIEIDEDIYGNSIYTTGVYQMYRYWAERFVSNEYKNEIDNNDGLYINATEGGTIRNGWVIMKFKSVISKYFNKVFNLDDSFNMDKKIEFNDIKNIKLNSKTKFSSRGNVGVEYNEDKT